MTTKMHVLGQRGISSIIIAPGPYQETIEQGRGRMIRLAASPVPYDPSYFLFTSPLKARSIIVKEQPDVVEIHSPYGAALSALIAPRFPHGIRTFVWHSDFIETYMTQGPLQQLPSFLQQMIARPFWTTIRAIATRCDATFAASKKQVQKLQEQGVPRVVHLPFGVDRTVFNPYAKDPALREQLLGPERKHAFLLIGVGRFAFEKRWDVVIDAFIQFRKRHEAVLVLIGDGPEQKSLKTQAAHHPDIHWMTFQRDRAYLARLFASADALVHGCSVETFGLVLAEAISCALPLVVPNAGGAAEQAKKACAELYTPGNSTDCATALERLLLQPQEQLRNCALQAAIDVYSLDDHFDRLLDIYCTLLSSKVSLRHSPS
ncbi:glycosyltransferase [Pajaroellobacter abortibovis]|uniref:glycosyltransferase n=1 Tax=Pajaroellobacter abortibovis TaxID=1882918 RepID=UPI0012EC6688|nr:glycosyltransferase [Pajaroellobacter abortibovis]